MKKFIASLLLGDRGHDGHASVEEISAEGATREEALEKILQEVRDCVIVREEFPDGSVLPLEVAGWLGDPPAGYRLFELVCCSHGDGYAYGRRFFALPIGKSFRLVKQCEGSNRTIVEGRYEAGNTPLRFTFVDSNSEYSYRFLCDGVLEYSGEEWVKNAEARYSY